MQRGDAKERHVMGSSCGNGMRFFLHPFLFPNSSSFSPASSPSHDTNFLITRSAGMENNSFAQDEGQQLQHALECLQIYLLPLFIFVGLLGSTLGILVLLGTGMRRKFLSHFLVCLNVASAAFLLTVLLSWLADNGVDVFAAPGLCQVYIFSSHFFPFVTFWHGVLGAYLVLWNWLRPGAARWLSSPTSAKTAVLAVSVLGFTVYSYKTWTYFSVLVKGVRICTVIPENEVAMEILNVLDVLILLVVPSLFFIVFFVVVVCIHCCGGPYRYQLAAGTCSTEVDALRCVCPKGDDSSRVEGRGSTLPMSRHVTSKQREVHRLVLSQTVFFLVLVVPRAVSTLVVTVHRWAYQQRHTQDEILLHHVFQFSFYFYFAILPYCPALTSIKFRTHCRTFFKRAKDRRQLRR